MPNKNAPPFKVMLCTVPDGSLAVTEASSADDEGRAFPAALGIQALVEWMHKTGFGDCYEFYDINGLRPSDDQIRKRFANITPTVIGLSAPLSHCYPNVKKIAAMLREMFPDAWIVVGGHVTASAEVILNKTETDICVVGDGELAWEKILKYIKAGGDRSQVDSETLLSIQGVSFIDTAGAFQFTGYGAQLPAGELNFIDFELMKEGLHDRPDLMRKYFLPSNENTSIKGALIDRDSVFYRDNNDYDQTANGTIADLPTSKGCVAKCTFCQRYSKGYRTYDLEKLETYILELKEKYNVNAFSIADENFGSNKKQAMQLAEIFKKNGIFWEATGVRCTSFSYEDLKFLSEHNLIYIKFGIESGSQDILDTMEKKFSRENVVNAIKNCRKLNLATTSDALMLGMPGESSQTVIDSANMIGHLRYILGYDNQIGGAFWATAFPGTPLYEYAQQIGMAGTTIDEEEDWLYRLSEAKTSLYNYSNLTGSDVMTVFFWDDLFKLEGKRAYLDNLLRDKIGIGSKLHKAYRFCIKPELNDYTYRLTALHDKSASHYVGNNMSALRKAMSHGSALSQLLLSLANLFLPRFIVYPVFKKFSDIKFNHIKKNLADSVGKLNLFQEQNNINTELLVTTNRLREKTRQQERSLRSIVKENRTLVNRELELDEYRQKRLVLSSGQ